MIGLVEGDGGLGPLQVMGCHRSDHVYFAINDLQSTLTFDISENHQSVIDFGVFFTAVFSVFNFVWLACWKYALEAIIKALLLYFLIHDNCLYSCYNCVNRKS